MVFVFDGVAFVYLLTAGSLPLLLRTPLRHLDNPGSRGFVIALVAMSLWPLALGVSNLVADLQLSIALWNVRILAAALVSIGWFLVAYEYTTQQLPPRSYLVGLGIYVLTSQSVCWTNSIHRLLLGPGTTLNGGVLIPEFGPWFWVQTAINYALIVSATALLAVEWSQSNGLRRRQSALLTLAVIPPIFANVLTITGAITTVHDMTPFGLVGSGIILSLALYRLEVLEIAPIARKLVVEEMEDAVIIVDSNDNIVDSNRTARSMFDIGDDYYGKLPAEVFPDRSELIGRDVDDGEGETEVTATIDGETRHFSRSVSTITLGPGRATAPARITVLRDITALKRREQELQDSKAELELMRQVLSRILRHNLRNKLTISQGYAEVLAKRYPDDDFRKLLDANEELLAIADKARDMERFMGTGTAERYDLAATVIRVVRRIESRHSDATITVATPDSCHVECVTGLDVAIENLVENAAEHGGDEPRIDVSVTEADEGKTSLRIDDDGPGIPDDELAVIESRRETLLSHGSGIGLWLVTWWADRSDVDLSFDTNSDGTTATITFDGLEDDSVAT